MDEQQEARPFQQINIAIFVLIVFGCAYFLFLDEPSDTSKLGAFQSLARGSVSFVTSTVTELFAGEPEEQPPQIQPTQTYRPTQTSQNIVPIKQSQQVVTPPTQVRPIFDSNKAQAIFDQAEHAHSMYQECSQRIIDYGNKINRVRDQGTLYQFDGDVNDCIEEYIVRSQKLAEMITADGQHVSRENLAYMRDITMRSAQNLRVLSYQYSQLSASRHQYIHQTYQTNSLINLGVLIGETVGAVSAGDAPSAIDSLFGVYNWWYYNGGVIDTGWGQ